MFSSFSNIIQWFLISLWSNALGWGTAKFGAIRFHFPIISRKIAKLQIHRTAFAVASSQWLEQVSSRQIRHSSSFLKLPSLRNMPSLFRLSNIFFTTEFVYFNQISCRLSIRNIFLKTVCIAFSHRKIYMAKAIICYFSFFRSHSHYRNNSVWIFLNPSLIRLCSDIIFSNIVLTDPGSAACGCDDGRIWKDPPSNAITTPRTASISRSAATRC